MEGMLFEFVEPTGPEREELVRLMEEYQNGLQRYLLIRGGISIGSIEHQDIGPDIVVGD